MPKKILQDPIKKMRNFKLLKLSVHTKSLCGLPHLFN